MVTELLGWCPGSRKQEEAGSSSSGSKKPQREDKSAEKDGELLLAGSSAGSAKSRHGGSVYDLLVAEIKVRSQIYWHVCEDPSWRNLLYVLLQSRCLLGCQYWALLHTYRHNSIR